MKHFCQATFLWSFFVWCCPHIVYTTSQPMFLAPDGAPKFSTWNKRKVTSSQFCWEGCQHYQQESRLEHSLVSPLNDCDKQLRHWSHPFKVWGMGTAAVNTWDAFLCHRESLDSRWMIILNRTWTKIFFNWKTIIWICTGNNYWQWTGSSKMWQECSDLWVPQRHQHRCSSSGAPSRRLIL